jgi:hypothetical protein
MTASLTWLGASRLRGSSMAGFSALAGALMIAVINTPLVAQLCSHFGLSLNDAYLVVTLVYAGSLLLFWMFPYLIPVIGTIRLLMIYFGTGFVVGW